jgi:hypothetical protein
VLEETIGRQALIALSNQYDSVADALLEIIDNPFDYRRGRKLGIDIRIDKGRDSIIVLDHGGEGMDAAALADWMAWGTGHEHRETDIGQYHVGGKLAVIYLAESVEIICRKAGASEIFKFSDPAWGVRTTLYSGHPETITPAQLPGDLAEIHAQDPSCGFTRIRLSKLKAHRYEVAILEAKLANAYRTLLRSGGARISVNKQEVTPLDIPYAPSYTDREIGIPVTKLDGGVTVRGPLWITDREKFKVGRGVGLKAGVRTVFNGRLITDGEEFNHYLAGRGSLQRLVGEIEIQRLRPNTTKDGWDRSDPKWVALESFMHEQMQPLVAFLNSLIEGRPVNRQQQKRAESVRRSVEETLKRMRQYPGTATGQPGEDQVAPGGRRPPVASDDDKPEPDRTRDRGEVKNRTVPPEDAIGRLLRRVQSGVPPVDFDDLGRTGRSQRRMTDAGPQIVINTTFPLYERLGETEDYLAETLFLHLLAEDEDTGLSPKEVSQRLDDLLFVWADVMAS